MTLIMVFNVWIALLSIWAMIREDKLHMAAVLSGFAALNQHNGNGRYIN